MGAEGEGVVNAFTGGFRVAQTGLAIDKALPDPAASAAALESAQIVALAILVREQMDPAQFAVVYRPFATILPGPGYLGAPPVDRQIAAFLKALPTLTGPPEAEIAAVARVLSELPKPAAQTPGTLAAVGAGPASLNPAANYTAACTQVIPP